MLNIEGHPVVKYDDENNNLKIRNGRMTENNSNHE